MPQLVKSGRRGDFKTDCDAISSLAKMRTRQTRRVESLLRALRSPGQVLVGLPKHTQLMQEWSAIKAAKGYHGPFSRWVLSVAHFHSFPVGLPTIDWLEDLVAYLKFDAKKVASEEATCRKNYFKHQLKLDTKYASARQGFAAVRGPAHPPFTEVPALRQAQVTWYEDQGPDKVGLSVLPVKHSSPMHQLCWRPASALCLRETATASCFREVTCPRTEHSSKSTSPVLVKKLAQEFERFWAPMWQRDHDLPHDLTEWEGVTAILQKVPSRLSNLAKQPRPLLEKAYLVQTAIWPSCFFGAEGHCHSMAEVARLRGAAARAILGDHKAMPPHLA